MLGFVIVFLGTHGHAEVRLTMNVLSDIGYAHSAVPQVVPVNWQDRFQPPKDGMTTHKYDYEWIWDLGAGIEPLWTAGTTWEIGLPVYYSFTFIGGGENGFFTTKKTVALTTVNWWDEVSVLEVKLEKTSPAVGISVADEHWKFQWAVQKYKIYIQDFIGVDRPGAKNTAKVVGEQGFERGLGQRLDIGYRSEKNDLVSYGIYYERNGGQVWLMGIGLKLSMAL